MTTLLLTPLLMPSWLDPEYLITAMGNWALWGVALIVFAECGIFSLLPGDSLLFAVGMFIALGTISFGDSELTTMIIALVVLTAAAVLGNLSGYWLGRLIGPPLFKPREGFWGKVFDPAYVEKTHGFFTRYGSKALIMARFVPMVRTFVTLVAGVGKMNLRKFMTYTAIGGVLWVVSITIAGYFLGGFPIIKDNFEAAVVLIVLVSVLPMLYEYQAHKRAKARLDVADGSAE